MGLNAASLAHLDGVNGDIRAVILRAAEITAQPFIVTDGLRTVAEQREFLRTGRTTTMNSRHLTGHAVDLAAIVNGSPVFNDRTPYRPIWFAVRTAAAELGVPIEWGGDWKSFVDVFHFQLPWADYPKGADVSFLDGDRKFDAEKFARVVDLVLDSEGGFNPADPSMRGITLDTLRLWDSTATLDQLKALTSAKAKDIYRALFYLPVRAGELPAGLDYAVFDFAVHSGPPVAAAHLQEAIGAEPDGVIGPLTLAAVARADIPSAITTLMSSRLARMKTLSNWSRNAAGWTARIEKVRKTALEMAKAPKAPPALPVPSPPTADLAAQFEKLITAAPAGAEISICISLTKQPPASGAPGRRLVAFNTKTEGSNEMTIPTFPNYKMYAVGVMVMFIGVAEGLLGWDIPGVEVGPDWLDYVLTGMGIGSLRAAIAKLMAAFAGK
jgi:lysozyme family protein